MKDFDLNSPAKGVELHRLVVPLRQIQEHSKYVRGIAEERGAKDQVAYESGKIDAIAEALKLIRDGALLTPPKCGEAGWVGHEWKMRGFYSDECVHCGTVAVDGHNGMKKDREHCEARAAKSSLHNAYSPDHGPHNSEP